MTKALTSADVWDERRTVYQAAVRTPLVRLQAPESSAEIYLKLECLQPIGSFKIRGAYTLLSRLSAAELARGVLTASAGNMGQGVAYAARVLGVPATVVAPDNAPRAKTDAIRRLGARIVLVPYDRFWQAMQDRAFEGESGIFAHPFDDPAVQAGNGTIALELLEDLPEVDTVLVPWGGGGLATGIATVLRTLRPQTKVYAVEAANMAALAASFAAGEPANVPVRPTIADGIGARSVFPKMWPQAQALLDGSLTASEEELTAAIRLLVERSHVVAEAAGACAAAVALSGRAGAGKIACIVSGANIDPRKLATILSA